MVPESYTSSAGEHGTLHCMFVTLSSNDVTSSSSDMTSSSSDVTSSNGCKKGYSVWRIRRIDCSGMGDTHHAFCGWMVMPLGTVVFAWIDTNESTPGLAEKGKRFFSTHTAKKKGRRSM